MIYKFVTAPENYPGKTYEFGNRILEHHLVWWLNTGEVVGDGFIIHHKNENKTDNRFENLEKMEIGEHTSLHKTTNSFITYTCPSCGVEFSRSERIHKSRKSKNVYCSNKCSSSSTKNGRNEISDDVKQKIKAMRIDGLSTYKISEVLKISRNTVMKYIK